ncbi:MAG: sigma-70 family RNA polymerase sigma factor [Dehalococcoidia bacterium]|nr:sigma-70 family RNA polymerase sigma factor [Dehalococcoidia bacterium]
MMAEALLGVWTTQIPFARREIPGEVRRSPSLPPGRTLLAVDLSADGSAPAYATGSAAAGAEDAIVGRLVEAARRGDAEAFGGLYDRFQPEILRYLTYQLRDRDTAEDLTQQAFLNAWRAIPRYEQRSVPVRAWLYRIARNQLLDHLKRRRRVTVDVDLVNPAADIDLEAHAVAEDERRLLRNALGHLSDDHRDVLVLRFLMEKSAAEVGLIMGRKEGTIRGLQFRALQALRSVMEELGASR